METVFEGFFKNCMKEDFKKFGDFEEFSKDFQNE